MSQIPRRLFLLGAAARCAARWLPAQAQAPQFAKVGFLFTPSRATSQVPALFSSAMSDIGWVEGRNLVMEWRFADGQRDNLPDLNSTQFPGGDRGASACRVRYSAHHCTFP